MNIWKLQQESLNLGLSANPNAAGDYKSGFDDGYNAAAKVLKRLSKWNPAEDNDYIMCESCEGIVKKSNRSNFCPHCGAAMVNGEEGGRAF